MNQRTMKTYMPDPNKVLRCHVARYIVSNPLCFDFSAAIAKSEKAQQTIQMGFKM